MEKRPPSRRACGSCLFNEFCFVYMSKLSIVLKNSAAFRGFFFECKATAAELVGVWCLAKLLSFIAASPHRFVLISAY